MWQFILFSEGNISVCHMEQSAMRKFNQKKVLSWDLQPTHKGKMCVFVWNPNDLSCPSFFILATLWPIVSLHISNVMTSWSM